MYELSQEQTLNASVDTLWDFISTPKNLNEITPPDMSFQIKSDLPKKMYNGLIVSYLVKIPLLGKTKWVSEIKHVREGVSFVDEQRIGPYKFWFHHHEIEQKGNKTIMRDVVHYEVPFGPFGKIDHSLFVRPMLERIFNYRLQKMDELFNVA